MNFYNEQLENELLNGVLIKQDSLYQLMEYDEDIFYFENNRLIYRALKELYESGKSVDSSILKIQLDESGYDIDGHLLEVYKSHTPLVLDMHLEKLSKLQEQRQLFLLSVDLRKAIENKTNYAEVINRIAYFADGDSKLSDSVTVKELSEMNLDELFKSSNFMRTGLKALDEKIIGLFNGQLVIVAGRPKMGKTTLALNIAENIGDHVLFFSMEMKRQEVYAKILSRHTNVTSWKIELNKMEHEEYERVFNCHMKIRSEIKMRFFDGAFNASKLKATIKKYAKTEKPVAVFIDYLQLITGGQGENQNLRISSITRDLKLLAMDLNIPIVLLSQLSRESEKQARRPVISDLRDSGSIEQDADIIIFAHEQDEQTEIIVGANRKGKSGIIKGIKFEKEFSRFSDAIQNEIFSDLSYIHD